MELPAFFLFAFLASVTPGPSNVLLTTIGAQMGVLRGLPALVGTAMGTGLILFTAGFGLGASVLGNEVVLSTLRVVGMGAILWLAWVIASAPISRDEALSTRELKIGFLPALLLQWVNPKAWIVSVSIVGAFMISEGSAFQQAATLSVVFTIAAVVGCLPWLVGGAALQRLLQNPTLARLINLALGLGLAVSMIALI
ncbi:Cysteine/O-acetylserine efflux protein [Ruegeria denitrificans]|uniref:Cysteine/O-acetylserine efflux protein n=1 Tax=Ruegeria denitrificans TaxID=1715692 RepID=A0A0P1IC15_9RHOB|nr:LysE family transporter [Ruegeria denitrificans]CUK04071.1 Cysteine/O-acetylserine efflux protein [Ruegeria denitrificans]